MIGEGVLVTAAAVLVPLVAVVLVAWLLRSAWSTARERRVAALRPPALQALATAIRDGDSAPAIAALGTLDRSARVAAVVDMAFTVAGDQRDRLNALVRTTGIWARGMAWARRRRWSSRLRAARLLAVFGSGAEAEGDRLLEDPRPEVRAQAADWAAEHANSFRLDRLVHMLADDDPRCAFAAREALIRSGRAAIPPIQRRLDASGDEVSRNLLVVAAPVAVPEFLPRALELCRASNPEIRAAAATLAGAIGGPEAVAELSRVLRDPSPRVRLAAVRGLGSLGHWQLAGQVAELLEDESWAVRRAAALALGRMGSTGKLLLSRAAREGSPAAVDTASYALGVGPALTGET